MARKPRQHQCSIEPLEQFDTQVVLQTPDLMTNGRLRDKQVVCCPGKTEMPGRQIEHAQRG